MDWESVDSRPGSFSKNFGWKAKPGLQLLHDVINTVFEDDLQPVRRERAREIIANNFMGDPLVPLNFFLYNKIIDGESYIVADQLVIQAIAENHNHSFDYLAMSALNFSRVGKWVGAHEFQSHPAPWARGFVVDVLYEADSWNPDKVQADTIEKFLDRVLVHHGDSTRKFATNLNFLYQHSGILSVRSSETDDWWGAALFLFLDRATMDSEIELSKNTNDILGFLDDERFWALTAIGSIRGRYAAKGVVDEYRAIGGIDRLNQPLIEEDGSKPKPPRNEREKVQRKVAKILQPKDLTLTPVQRLFSQAQRQVRNRVHVSFLKALYEDECAICGMQLQIDPSHKTYSEAGHLKPVGKPINGPDHLSNLLLFCPNHHKVFDYGGIWIDSKGEIPIIRSSIDDQSFDQRRLIIHKSHDLDLQYAEWHAKYFGHG